MNLYGVYVYIVFLQLEISRIRIFTVYFHQIQQSSWEEHDAGQGEKLRNAQPCGTQSPFA